MARPTITRVHKNGGDPDGGKNDVMRLIKTDESIVDIADGDFIEFTARTSLPVKKAEVFFGPLAHKGNFIYLVGQSVHMSDNLTDDELNSLKIIPKKLGGGRRKSHRRTKSRRNHRKHRKSTRRN